MLVLEDHAHAKARGARIYGEIAGYGLTSDGHDMVAPSGEGAERCMRMAIAGLEAPIDYINPHATSTPVGDAREIEAVRRIFGSGEKCPPIAATKSLTGHSQGATGVQEAIYSLLMMNSGFICESAQHRRDRSRFRRHEHRVRAPRRAARPRAVELVRIRRHQRGARAQACRRPEHPVAGLMAGRRGLIMGVANDHSIAWGIAKALRAQGAELAFSYQGEALGRRVRPLAESLGSSLVLPCDVDTIASIDEIFASLRSTWNDIDFVVHCIAYSAKAELKGRYADTTRENFSKTMLVSAFSFTEIAKRAAAMMRPGGSLLTLTFGGATRVMPNYNVMGVAKAALEASVRYLAADYGPDRIRVNAISAGPIRTLAGAGITDSRAMYAFQRDHAPMRRSVTIEDVGGAALYLLSELSSGVTGEVHYVDAGYNIVSMPHPDRLKSSTERDTAD